MFVTAVKDVPLRRLLHGKDQKKTGQ